MQNSDNIELMYELLTESHLDLMYLPSGAIAWLFDRPEEQVQAASKVGVEAHRYGNDITDSALLRADKNVLVLKTKSGASIKVYPGGWYGVDGESFAEIEGIIQYLEEPQGVIGSDPTVDLPDPHMGVGMDNSPVARKPGKVQYATKADLSPDDGMSDLSDVGMDDLAFDLPDSGMSYGDLLMDDDI